jgi:hypothetical protein
VPWPPPEWPVPLVNALWNLWRARLYFIGDLRIRLGSTRMDDDMRNVRHGRSPRPAEMPGARVAGAGSLPTSTRRAIQPPDVPEITIMETRFARVSGPNADEYGERAVRGRVSDPLSGAGARPLD